MKRLTIALVVASCGTDPSPGNEDAAIDSPTVPDAPVDSAAVAFSLTSPDLASGATFAMTNTCDGANTSPQLAWTGNAMGAASFAVVLTDTSNMLVHWVIYDIPASAAGLPANVDKLYAPTNVAGAHQTLSYQATVRGYLGPCPPQNGGAHVYEFAAYGINAAALPGATMTTTRAQAVAAIIQYQTARATLTGMYER